MQYTSVSMAQNFCDIEEAGVFLVDMISSGKAENQLLLIKNQTMGFYERHVETRNLLQQILGGGSTEQIILLMIC